MPALVRKVVTKAKDEMDEDDRALAAMGYTPVSFFPLFLGFFFFFFFWRTSRHPIADNATLTLCLGFQA